MKLAKSLDEHGISWIRPKVGFLWNDQGNRYYPDFYLPDFNVYLDPKNNYLRKIDKYKIDNVQLRNNIRVLVLSEEQLDWQNIASMV